MQRLHAPQRTSKNRYAAAAPRGHPTRSQLHARPCSSSRRARCIARCNASGTSSSAAASAAENVVAVVESSTAADGATPTAAATRKSSSSSNPAASSTNAESKYKVTEAEWKQRGPVSTTSCVDSLDRLGAFPCARKPTPCQLFPQQHPQNALVSLVLHAGPACHHSEVD